MIMLFLVIFKVSYIFMNNSVRNDSIKQSPGIWEVEQKLEKLSQIVRNYGNPITKRL